MQSLFSQRNSVRVDENRGNFRRGWIIALTAIPEAQLASREQLANVLVQGDVWDSSPMKYVIVLQFSVGKERLRTSMPIIRIAVSFREGNSVSSCSSDLIMHISVHELSKIGGLL